MISTPSNDQPKGKVPENPSYAQLEALLVAKDAEIARLRAENVQLRADLGKCRAYRMHIKDTCANTDMDAGDKVVLLSTIEELREAAQDTGRDPDEPPNATPEQVRVWHIAKRAGISPQSAGDRLKRLHKLGAIVRPEPRKARSTAGAPITRVDIALTPKAFTPRLLRFPDEDKPQRGGKRVRVCEQCGSENLVTRTFCADCGLRQDDDHPVYHEIAPELVTEPVPPTAPVPSPVSQVDSQGPTDEPAPDPEPDPEPEQSAPVKLPGRFCLNNPAPPFGHTPHDLDSGHTVCGKCGALLGLWDRDSARRLVRAGG